MKIQGVVRGTSIALEEPIPALDGRRVSVVLEAVDADATDASPEELRSAWDLWVASCRQGPLEDEGDGWP